MKTYIEVTSQSLSSYDLNSQIPAVKDYLYKLISNRPYYLDSILNFSDKDGLLFCQKLLQDNENVYVPVHGIQVPDDDRYYNEWYTYDVLVSKSDIKEIERVELDKEDRKLFS